MGTKKSDAEAAASIIVMTAISWVSMFLHPTSSPYSPVFLAVFGLVFHFIVVSRAPVFKALLSTFSPLVSVNSVTLKNNKMIKQSAANVPAGRVN